MDEIGKYHDKISIGHEATISVSQPSIGDKQETLENITQCIDDCTKEISQIQSIANMNIGSAQTFLERVMEEKIQLESLLRDEKEFNQDFGTVLATSGYKISKWKNCTID